jgi:nicotinate dehydrogenase subunit B
MTELAGALAEELDVALDAVDVVMGDTDLCPYDMGTFGSMCTPLLWPAVRKAGAEAKAVLLQMASERLQVPAGQLHVESGGHRNRASHRTRSPTGNWWKENASSGTWRMCR